MKLIRAGRILLKRRKNKRIFTTRARQYLKKEQEKMPINSVKTPSLAINHSKTALIKLKRD